MNEMTRRAISVAALLVLVFGAAIAVLMYWLGRGELLGAARATLKTDLRNLAVAESLYFKTHRRYTGELRDLPEFAPRGQVSVDLADSNSWEATAVDAKTYARCTFGSADLVVKC